MRWHRFTDRFCSLRVLAAGFSSRSSPCAASHRIIARYLRYRMRKVQRCRGALLRWVFYPFLHCERVILLRGFHCAG